MLRPVQAVIVAGGLGTRLRPLTFNRPKALVPLLNRPQILRILDQLPSSVDEVFVAVNYMYERVRDALRETPLGRTVTVVDEPTPLGTAGAVKSLESRLQGTFAVYNGDVIDSMSLTEFLAFHRKHRALATVALYEVDDPSPFGVVAMEGSRITRFVEKPPRAEAPSHLVNAGRYVFEPDVLDEIPKGIPVSMERDLFPNLAKDRLHGFPFTGYWSDAGTLSGYINATSILLANGGAAVGSGAKVAHATLDGAVLVPDGCVVSGRIGPNVAMGPRCRVDDGTVSNSVLLEGASIEAGGVVSGSVIGEDSSVGPGAVVEDSIIGDGVRVGKGRRVIQERMA